MADSRESVKQLLTQLECLYRDALELDYELDRQLARGECAQQLLTDVERLKGDVRDFRGTIYRLCRGQRPVT